MTKFIIERLVPAWAAAGIPLLLLLMFARLSVNGALAMAAQGDLKADRSAAATELISIGLGGSGANHDSWASAVSADGRVVVFRSRATNLISGDITGSFFDIFVRSRPAGTTWRVSVSSGGQPANGESEFPAISGDGRVVAFSSLATNLVSGDTNGLQDVFVHDLTTAQTRRVSVRSGGSQGELGGSSQPVLSFFGRFVAFQSEANNLVAGDSNGTTDIFIHDRATGITERVSIASDGTQGNSFSIQPAISDDGQVIAFASRAFTLVADDTNFKQDIFVHDRSNGQTTRVSVDSSGQESNGGSANPSLSGDGRYVVFESTATNLVPGDTNDLTDIFRHDRQTGETIRLSTNISGTQSNGQSGYPSISNDGRYVAFESTATNLIDHDQNGAVRDIFIKHAALGTVQQVTLDTAGGGSTGGSFWARLASQGNWVTYSSDAGDLVPGDANGRTDVFVTEVEGPPPAWTLMFYLAGDGGRSREYPMILNQLEAAASNEAVQVFALYDGHLPGDTALYEIQPDFNLARLASYVENVNYFPQPEANMADPDRLRSFIETVYARSAAPNVVLILDGYGHGLGGGLCDGGCGRVMTLKDLASALSSAQLTTGRSIDVLMAFANGMAMVEDAHLLQDQADYYVASQADMTAWPAAYRELVASVAYTATAEQVAAGLAEAYAGVGEANQAAYTIAVFDLAQAAGLAAAADQMGAALKNNLGVISPTLQAQVVSQVQRFGLAGEAADLAHFAGLAQVVYAANTEIETAVQGVINEINNTVIFEAHRSSGKADFSQSGGLSIYLPQQPAPFYNENVIPFAIGGWSGGPAGQTWAGFLVDFVDMAYPGAPAAAQPPDPHPKISPYTFQLFLPGIRH